MVIFGKMGWYCCAKLFLDKINKKRIWFWKEKLWGLEHIFFNVSITINKNNCTNKHITSPPLKNTLCLFCCVIYQI